MKTTAFDVINPSTGEAFDTCPISSQEQLEETILAANEAFKSWSKTPDDVRANALNQMADLMEEYTPELARLLTLEQGKPLKGLGSEFEIGACVGWLRATAAMKIEDKVLEDSNERKAILLRKPVGVVASITPWNWPLMIAIWHIAPAIRVGCTAVIKPANLTPLSTVLMVSILNKVLPKGVLSVITGAAGHQLSSHPKIHKVVFTGSTPVGKVVMKNASDSLKKLTLELGGNDAGIVLPDVNVEEIAEGLFWGAFINGGQTCAALKRLYVHEDIYDEVCEALTKIAISMPMGDGLDENNMFGPVQNQGQFDLVSELVEDAKKSGARILCGGEAATGNGYFYPLTLVADAVDGMRVVDEEQFGPILPIIKYNNIEDAIKSANQSDFGLGGSIWSKNIEKATEIAAQIESGSVWINGHGQVLPHIPFGGVKSSGIGVEFGIEGLHEYTTTQSMHIPK
ncbi:aldehyde dehydrogenase family protein [Pseudoalteromonas neustonica]|uniref:Aldehyde dehydrogenase family protein n=1 Tax=Pseudoalteromonas neustonica TaxID=1840331 RepID=A0ABU9U180_9GAMM